MDPPSPVTDLHSTATASRRRRGTGTSTTREPAYGEQRRSAVAVGDCPDLNGAACSARTEMERACERMEFCGANEISRAPTGQVSGEPDAQRGFTGAIL